jgi:hypothetical protein
VADEQQPSSEALPSSEGVSVDGQALSIAELEAVARHGARLELGAAGRARLTASQATLEQAIAEGQVLYGVNTGFGSLARQRVSGDQLREIQRNLILSGPGPRVGFPNSQARRIGNPLLLGRRVRWSPSQTREFATFRDRPMSFAVARSQ